MTFEIKGLIIGLLILIYVVFGIIVIAHEYKKKEDSEEEYKRLCKIAEQVMRQ